MSINFDDIRNEYIKITRNNYNYAIDWWLSLDVKIRN